MPIKDNELPEASTNFGWGLNFTGMAADYRHMPSIGGGYTVTQMAVFIAPPAFIGISMSVIAGLPATTFGATVTLGIVMFLALALWANAKLRTAAIWSFIVAILFALPAYIVYSSILFAVIPAFVYSYRLAKMLDKRRRYGNSHEAYLMDYFRLRRRPKRVVNGKPYFGPTGLRPAFMTTSRFTEVNHGRNQEVED